MALIRVKYVRLKKPCILLHPSGELVNPEMNKPYRNDDPLVRKFPWAFEADDERPLDDK